MVDPGYQEERPELTAQLRGIGGIDLRVGRFFSLGFLYLLRNFGAKNEDERLKNVLSDLVFEWNAM